MGRLRGVVAFTLSLFVLLAGVLVVLPVEQAAADSVELGPDGYFSALEDTDGDGQILPVVDNETGTPGSTAANGWANTRRILFGKQKSTDSSTAGSTYGSYQVSGGYKTLAKGPVASESGRSFYVSSSAGWTKSSTTSVAAEEALLFADDVVATFGAFADGSDCSGDPCNSFDSVPGSYKSNLALVSDELGVKNYSSFEQSLLRDERVEGVCAKQQSLGCGSGNEPTDTQFSPSAYEYKVFPLSLGDVNKYLNHTSGFANDSNLACPSNSCANDTVVSWLRTASWNSANAMTSVQRTGSVSGGTATYSSGLGLRPAVRLNLEHLLLSADSSNQGQGGSGDLRLTVVETGKKLTSWSASVSGGVGSRALSLSGGSDLGSELGWKVVDPVSNTVLGSGRTSSGGNMALPESSMGDESKDYDLYVWGQQDGNAADGLTNKATEPVKVIIKGWQVKTPPPYGIEVTGTTVGELKAYRIGDYAELIWTGFCS
jgi:hypothetical protein